MHLVTHCLVHVRLLHCMYVLLRNGYKQDTQIMQHVPYAQGSDQTH